MNGQIRLTEQGEVIASKYANPEVGRLNLEAIVAATLETTLRESHYSVPDEFIAAAERISDASTAAYRGLVYETPGFADYFFSATPIAEIAELNIGSRPASRRASRRIEDLRAIPWSFSWGQARVNLPGWFGFGSGVQAFLADAPDQRMKVLRRMHREWPFFRALLSNMDMVLAKTDLALAKRYAELSADRERAAAIFGALEAEWTRTVAALNDITGTTQRLADNPVLRRFAAASRSLYRAAQSSPGRASPPLANRFAGRADAARHSDIDQRNRGRTAQHRLIALRAQSGEVGTGSPQDCATTSGTLAAVPFGEMPVIIEDCLQQDLRALRALFLRGIFHLVVADAVLARDENHRRRRNARHISGIVSGAGDDLARR